MGGPWQRGLLTGALYFHFGDFFVPNLSGKPCWGYLLRSGRLELGIPACIHDIGNTLLLHEGGGQATAVAGGALQHVATLGVELA